MSVHKMLGLASPAYAGHTEIGLRDDMPVFSEFRFSGISGTQSLECWVPGLAALARDDSMRALPPSLSECTPAPEFVG